MNVAVADCDSATRWFSDVDVTARRYTPRHHHHHHHTGQQQQDRRHVVRPQQITYHQLFTGLDQDNGQVSQSQPVYRYQHQLESQSTRTRRHQEPVVYQFTGLDQHYHQTVCQSQPVYHYQHQTQSTTAHHQPLYTVPQVATNVQRATLKHSRHTTELIVQCFTSPPTQYRLHGRRFLQVKRSNQQYQSTEGSYKREIKQRKQHKHTCRDNNAHTKRYTHIKHSKSPSLQQYGVTRGQLPQRAGSLGLTAVGLPPRYPCTDGIAISVLSVAFMSERNLTSKIVCIFCDRDA